MEVLDYTFERRLELEKNDSFIEGREIGIQQGIEQGMRQGIQQGISQGISQGVTRGINETIARMRNNGVADDEIARLTGFDMETIHGGSLK